MPPLHIASGNNVCPLCNSPYDGLASHWAKSSCGYPTISREQRRFFEAILSVGRGGIALTESTNRFSLAVSYGELATYLLEQMGILGGHARMYELKNNPDQNPAHSERISLGANGQQFSIVSHAHPLFDRLYERFYERGERVYPTMDVTPTEATLWTALRGSLIWSSGGQKLLRFNTNEPNLKEAIAQSIGRSLGKVPPVTESGVILSVETTTDWFDYIRGSLPGVEFLWTDSHSEYDRRRLKTRGKSQIMED